MHIYGKLCERTQERWRYKMVAVMTGGSGNILLAADIWMMMSASRSDEELVLPC